MDLNVLDDSIRVPAACTLPTAEQPVRVAEFDAFFAEDVLAVSRTSSERLTIAVRPEAAGRAATLAVKETRCCSFFTFDLRVGGGEVTLAVGVQPGHAGVLAALGDRAERLIRESGR